MSERFPSQTQDKFTVRFPEGMRDAIAERAKANGRSMNSEIIAALEMWLADEPLEELNETNVNRMYRIVTKLVTKELVKNYDLTPKEK